jgi:hypothetical protein
MSTVIYILTSSDDDYDDTSDCPSFVVCGTLDVGGKFELKWHDNIKERMKTQKETQT